LCGDILCRASLPAAGLGQWSDDEIKRAITQGIARDGHKLKPPMAYAAYASMTAQDLDALVASGRYRRGSNPHASVRGD
jgi:hypothetical protein